MPPATRASLFKDLALLTILCSALYLPGLTTHGVTNWQEAQRLHVARDMQLRGSWLLPTTDGIPYLAKPPMVYWCQIALAELTGSRVTLFHLRLTVALAATLGVLATYLAARSILARAHDLPPPNTPTDTFARSCALWSAAVLATGVLYFRSARIGELDILLVPAITLAIAAIIATLRHAREHPSSNPPLYTTLAATLSATLAALTKDTALPIIALAYIPALITRDPKNALRTILRSGAPVVLLVPVLARALWALAATDHLDPTVLATLTRQELDQNINVFHADAWLNNLEALSFGVGAAAPFALLTLFWMLRHKPRLSQGLAVLLAWTVGTFLIFSLLGKGVPRYLTPMWPPVAILAGVWIARFTRPCPEQPERRAVFVTILAVLAVAQLVHYALLREIVSSPRSPRAFIRELLRTHAVDPARIVTYNLDTKAIDYYVNVFQEDPWADIRVYPVASTKDGQTGIAGVNTSMAGGFWSEQQLLDALEDGPVTIIHREQDAEHMQQLGITLTPIRVSSRFLYDSFESTINASIATKNR